MQAVRPLIVAAMIALPAVTLATPATAQTPNAQAVTFLCRASAFGQTKDFTFNQPVDAAAPAQAAAGSALAVALSPAANTVPANAGNYPVNYIKDIALTVPTPTNSSYVSAALSGGRNLGGKPSVSSDANTTVVHTPGPINGGSQFQLPTLTLKLTAGGPGRIESRVGGTGYSDPGLTFTANVHASFFDVDVPVSCYPSPNPTLTVTTVS